MRHFKRGAFVWTPKQAIKHEAMFSDLLRGEQLRRTDEGVNRWFMLRRTFELAGETSGKVSLSADGRCRLGVNGETVGYGPTRSNPLFQRIDTFDVSGYLRPGLNCLALLVSCPGVDLAWYETVRGHWQPVFGDGGVYCELELRGGGLRGDEPLYIVTDDQWTIREAHAWSRDTPRAGWGQNFIENVDARVLPEWSAPDFDDGDWDRARPLVSTGSEDFVARGWGKVEAFPHLTPSGLPEQRRELRYPAQLVWVKGLDPRPDLPLERRLFEEKPLENTSPKLVNAAALLGPAGVTTVVAPPGKDVALMLKFPYHAGHPVIHVEARGGEVIDVACGEALPGEYAGRGDPGDGLSLSSYLDCAHVFRYTARPGLQRFEKFDWTAVRALQVVVRNAPEGLKLHAIGSVGTHYPAERRGEFFCSDDLLNRLWEVGSYTALQCMHDSWVDCPGREKRHWIGDAAIDCDIAARAFGPSTYALTRQTLLAAAESQRNDGLLQMFAPGDHHVHGLTIVDFSLHFLLCAARYLVLSGDVETVNTIWPALSKVLDWFERYRGPSGLLADLPHWHFIEWAHVGRNGEGGAVNALYGGALAAAMSLAKALGDTRVLERCRKTRGEVKAALNTRHWDAGRGLYVDAVDPEGGAQQPRVSQHTNALMILFELAPKERWLDIVRHLTDGDKLRRTSAPPIVTSGQPFDEHEHIVEAQMYFSHFVYAALAKTGAIQEVFEHMHKIYGPMLASGTETLWEGPEPHASLCHVFSATPVYQLSRYVLGVADPDPNTRTVAISPQLGDLQEARGVVPTGLGDVRVTWRTEASGVSGDVSLPEGLEPAFTGENGLGARWVKKEENHFQVRWR